MSPSLEEIQSGTLGRLIRKSPRTLPPEERKSALARAPFVVYIGGAVYRRVREIGCTRSGLRIISTELLHSERAPPEQYDFVPEPMLTAVFNEFPFKVIKD